MNYTDIQWTWAIDPATGLLIPKSGWTWNPLVGCRKKSSGCENCYAERLIATRLSQRKVYKGLAVMKESGPQFTGEHRLIVDRLDEPLRKRNPRCGKTFVNDLGDLFYEGHTNEEIAAVFGVMAAAHWHTFQVLTKRARRMAEWFEWIEGKTKDASDGAGDWKQTLRDVLTIRLLCELKHAGLEARRIRDTGAVWPLPNVWLGVSTEDQVTADDRIPWLLRCPVRVRFLSVEPQIGPVDLSRWMPRTWGPQREDGRWWCNTCCNGDRCDDATHVDRRHCPRCAGTGIVDKVNWIIDGGESGPRPRPFDLAWTRSTQAQCRVAGVAYFRKQLGANPIDSEGKTDQRRHQKDSHGGDESEWPAELRACRAFPVAS